VTLKIPPQKRCFEVAVTALQHLFKFSYKYVISQTPNSVRVTVTEVTLPTFDDRKFDGICYWSNKNVLWRRHLRNACAPANVKARLGSGSCIGAHWASFLRKQIL